MNKLLFAIFVISLTVSIPSLSWAADLTIKHTDPEWKDGKKKGKTPKRDNKIVDFWDIFQI